jgi:hypothetical protein
LADDNLDGVDINRGPAGGDADIDGLPDAAEGGACPGAIAGVSDSDGDLLADGLEAVLGSSPAGFCLAGAGFPDPGLIDSDGDAMDDGWEMKYWQFFCPATNASIADGPADAEGDGLPNIGEYMQATSPCLVDTDGDGFPDPPAVLHHGPSNPLLSVDNCPAVANPAQINSDGNFVDVSPPLGFDDKTRANSDALGDACDTDDDNDGLPDGAETGGPPCASASGPTSSMLFDTDGDRVGDGAECTLGYNPVVAASKPPAIVAPDGDLDGLPDGLEPIGCAGLTDCDGDGLRDGVEFRGYNTSPTAVGSDGDPCSDTIEAMSMDGNGFITAGDLGIIAGNLGTPGVNADFDIDKNGAITAGDLGLAASRIGSPSCSVTW